MELLHNFNILLRYNILDFFIDPDKVVPYKFLIMVLLNADILFHLHQPIYLALLSNQIH